MSLYKRKDSPYWWVKLTVDGETLYKSSQTANKKQATEYEAKLRNSLWEQKRLGVKPKFIWQEAVVRYIDETSYKKSHITDMYHLRWLSPHLDGMYLHEINRNTLDRIASARKKDGVSNATVNRCMRVFQSILRRATDEWEWLDRAPKLRRLPEPQKRVRYLTIEDANRLLSLLPPHLAAMVKFSLATGLRQANVYGFKWEQVDLAKKRAWIYADQAKGGESFSVPLNQDAMAVLRGERFKHQTHVFTYKALPVTNVKGKAWRNALVRAGITNFRWHDLRHTWASWHVQNGTPLHVLQELGGWKSFDMVQKYAHLSSEHLAPYVEGVCGLLESTETNVTTNKLRLG